MRNRLVAVALFFIAQPTCCGSSLFFDCAKDVVLVIFFFIRAIGSNCATRVKHTVFYHCSDSDKRLRRVYASVLACKVNKRLSRQSKQGKRIKIDIEIAITLVLFTGLLQIGAQRGARKSIL